MSKRQPDATALSRIQSLTALLREKLPQLDGYATLLETRNRSLERDRTYAEIDLQAWIVAIGGELDDTSAHTWVDWYLYPLARGLDHREEFALRIVGERLASTVIESRANDQLITEKLIARARHILEHAGNDYEILPGYHYGNSDPLQAVRADPRSAWLSPKLDRCALLVAQRPTSSDVLGFAEFVLAGSWDQRLIDVDEDEDEDEEGQNPGTRVAEHFGWLGGAVEELALKLIDADSMSVERFVQATRTWGSALNACGVSNGLAEPTEEVDEDEDDQCANSPARKRLEQLAADHLESLLSDWPASTSEVEQAFGDLDVHHERWQLLGLKLIEQAELAPGKLKDDYDHPEQSLVLSLIKLNRFSDAPADKLVDAFSQFSQQTLLTALPFAGVSRNLILKALGWEDLMPLQGQLFAIAGTTPTTIVNSFDDVPNCESVKVGVIDRAALDLAIEQANPKHVSAYLKALWAAKISLKSTKLVFEAYLGKNRAALEKKLVRHGQVAIRAYGALPMIDIDDVRERYQAFMRMHKEVTQYGPERQANSQAAVKAGLSNLAQAAGYADSTRLEWAMEAEIAESAGSMQYELGDYEVALALDGLNASIQVSKKGKTLKSIPAAVRKFDEYAELKQMQAQMKDQVRRFRKALEGMLCSGELLPVKDLSRLVRMPAMRLLLDQLLLQSDSGAIGWFDADSMTLIDINGAAQPIENGARIAHPLHLFEAEQLSQWQQKIVQQRRVQPFKQAFRELYLLTPAERETRTYSNRFHGQVVTSAVASRLLQSRNWSVNNGEYEPVSKYDQGLGIDAQMSFPDIGHYLAETDIVTIDQISFRHKREDMVLDDVPPLLFSEIMRDADLVASVAQANDEFASSSESIQRRAELVLALISDIGLDRVRCEGHFAHIQGSLANYRVHLGSATIHIEPGNYLCVVPARGDDEKVYLPFADTDKKMSEVISKIFLLLDDQSITDETILEQIRVH